MQYIKVNYENINHECLFSFIYINVIPQNIVGRTK